MALASQPLPESPASPSYGGGDGGFTLVHPDIIRTRILSRLDGPSLASAACVSSLLRSLSSEDELWQDICAITWPSTTESRLHELISAFRSGFRSFYSDACPLLHLPTVPNHPITPSPRIITRLISAVDIFHGGSLLFSKVQETESSTPWFMSAPFRIDLIEKKEPVKTAIPYRGQNNRDFLDHLEEKMKLSWILIDPFSKRAVSLPSPWPVSVGMDRLNGGIQVHFSSILKFGCEEFELVECRALLTCKGDVDGMMEIREISMRMEDVEGRGVNGESCMLILAMAMEGGKRRAIGWRGKEGEEGIAMKERFEEFGEKRRKRRERKQRREKALDMACIASGIAIFAGFLIWCLA